jgi:L,D-transpeptidase ErfK/SrfK
LKNRPAASPAPPKENVVSVPVESTDENKTSEKKTAPEKADGAAGGEESLDVADADENQALPDYPPGARIASGEMKTYMVREEDTFLDIARHFGLGYVELRAANPDVDPWAPTPGESLVIPSFSLLPRAKQEGIVVNLGDMRLFYFKNPGEEPVSYAIGIGREGLQTPTGETKIIRKAAGPSWYPTERMRKEKPFLPSVVPPGPSNPLGTHALYLGWPTFLIHGSNKPWGIGRRVSSGCMRMYPEDIVAFFDMIPVGTKVTVVDQPVLIGWLDDGLYLEANPTKTQSNEIEIDGDLTVKPLTDKLRAMIIAAAGDAATRIDWETVEKAVEERRGYPILIATRPDTKERKADMPQRANKPPARTAADPGKNRSLWN